MPTVNIKTINGFVYILCQTDIHKTRKSQVIFGVFDSYEHAHHAADEEKLKTTNSDFVILTVKINQFAEVY